MYTGVFQRKFRHHIIILLSDITAILKRRRNDYKMSRNTRNQKLNGYLEKKGKLSFTCCWHKYWFILDGKYLLYYKSKKHYETLGTCKGFIDFNLAQSVRLTSKSRVISRGCPFEVITRTQIIYLSAADEETRACWVGELQNIIKLPVVSNPVSGYVEPQTYLTQILSDHKAAKRDVCGERSTNSDVSSLEDEVFVGTEERSESSKAQDENTIDGKREIYKINHAITNQVTIDEEIKFLECELLSLKNEMGQLDTETCEDTNNQHGMMLLVCDAEYGMENTRRTISVLNDSEIRVNKTEFQSDTEDDDSGDEEETSVKPLLIESVRIKSTKNANDEDKWKQREDKLIHEESSNVERIVVEIIDELVSKAEETIVNSTEETVKRIEPDLRLEDNVKILKSEDENFGIESVELEGSGSFKADVEERNNCELDQVPSAVFECGNREIYRETSEKNEINCEKGKKDLFLKETDERTMHEGDEEVKEKFESVECVCVASVSEFEVNSIIINSKEVQEAIGADDESKNSVRKEGGEIIGIITEDDVVESFEKDETGNQRYNGNGVPETTGEEDISKIYKDDSEFIEIDENEVHVTKDVIECKRLLNLESENGVVVVRNHGNGYADDSRKDVDTVKCNDEYKQEIIEESDPCNELENVECNEIQNEQCRKRDEEVNVLNLSTGKQFVIDDSEKLSNGTMKPDLFISFVALEEFLATIDNLKSEQNANYKGSIGKVGQSAAVTNLQNYLREINLD